MNKLLRCAIYIRVSTEEQHLNGLSLPAQKKALTEYAQAQGYTIVASYADEGISARKPMKNRKWMRKRQIKGLFRIRLVHFCKIMVFV